MAGIPAPNVCISTPRVFGLRGRFAICMPHMFTYNIATACFSFGGGVAVDIVDHTGPCGAQLVSNQMVWFSCWEINFCNIGHGKTQV